MVNIHLVFKVVLVLSILLLVGLVFKTRLPAGVSNSEGFNAHHRIGVIHLPVQTHFAPEIAVRNTP